MYLLKARFRIIYKEFSLFYRAGGRYAAVIEPKIIYLEQNRVDIVFEISEGPLSKVTVLSFWK